MSITERVEELRNKIVEIKPSISIEKAKIWTDVHKENEDKPVIIKRALSFKKLCEKKEIRILENELIIGDASEEWRQGMVDPSICSEFIHKELDTISHRDQDPFDFSEKDKEIFEKKIWPYWKGKSVYSSYKEQLPKKTKKILETGLFGTSKISGGPGEIAPNFPKIINVGVNNIQKKIKKELEKLDLEKPESIDKRNFLEAEKIVCEGLKILAKRYSKLAENKAKETNDIDRKKELNKISKICERVPSKPARTFWEALQSMWFYLTALWMESNAPSYTLGRVDQYLYPFYKKDIEEGIITKKDAQELLEMFDLKVATRIRLLSEDSVKHFSGYMSFQTVVCGGITPEGEDGVNELSYMILKSKDDLRLNQPSLKVRMNKKNPYKFWKKVAELIREGTGYPPVFNDEVGMKMVMDKGVPPKEARNWVPLGCVEAAIPDKYAQITDIGHYNGAAAIEFVLTNGRKRIGDKKDKILGLKTGELSEFNTFEEFKEGVKQQLKHLIHHIQIHGVLLTYLLKNKYQLPVQSLSIDDCIEKGKDRTEGGAKYNSGYAVVFTGIADVADSLVAIKKLVYEEEKFTLEELEEALENNFEGYRDIHQLCLNAPKYGNDIHEVDELAREITDYCSEVVRESEDVNGFRNSHALYPVTTHVPMGLDTGALPSGRKAKVPLADGVSPAQGNDKEGPTAVIKSVTTLNHEEHSTGTLLNQKFSPNALKTDRDLENFISLIKTYFDLGGYHIQFNVIGAKDLKDAQKNPEEYKDLLVRVAGYSAYFVELSQEVQNEIISRSEQARLN